MTEEPFGHIDMRKKKNLEKQIIQGTMGYQKTLHKEMGIGALDKYNIYLFASCSKENFKINPYQKFWPMRFHFI